MEKMYALSFGPVVETFTARGAKTISEFRLEAISDHHAQFTEISIEV